MLFEVNDVDRQVYETELRDFLPEKMIDIHTHVFVGSDKGKFANGINSISPDDFTLRAGITTVVDAGTSGWQNFEYQNLLIYLKDK